MAKLSIRNRNKDKLDKNGKLKSPNWEYRFETASVNGRRKFISKAGFRTKKDAEVAGTQAMAEYNNTGLNFEPSDISVSDYLDFWLDSYCKLNIADSTYTGYHNIINKHIKPRIGHYRLKTVTTLTLQKLINDIYIEKRFTKSFMKNILKVLKGTFKYAKVTAKLIKDNPAEDVTLPNMAPDSDSDDIIILSKESINRILERFKKSPAIYYAILTSYYTGLRVSEVYGLTWDCIDLENHKLTVNKIVKRIGKTLENSETKQKYKSKEKFASDWYLGACKTTSSYRTIDIGDALVAALKEYKVYQEKNELEYDEYYTKQYVVDEISQTNRNVQRILSIKDVDIDIPLERTHLVFVKENGEFHGSDVVKYASRVINNELLIDFNFHALRHTHATMLIEAGVDVKSVSDRLGHGNTRTTLDTYVHVTDSMRSNAATTFETFGNLVHNSGIVDFRDFKRNRSSKFG